MYVRVVAAVRNLREYFAPHLYVYALISMLAVEVFYLLLMCESNVIRVTLQVI